VTPVISPRRLLVDGLILSALFSVVAVGSLWLNPASWLDDYPPDVRAAIGDSIQQPRALQVVTGALLVLVVIGGLTWSLRRLDSELCGIGFWSASLHTFLIFWIINTVDVVVVDWLFFMNLLRSRVVLPGTDGLAGYDDYFFHFRSSFLSSAPWVGSFVLSVVVGAGWWWFVARRRQREAGELKLR